ncbi:hypothetical protein MHK_009936 [Candidatus Magnetomorum sp. HK-1]|nr:hypothetical protein MHK_009936 [Candidatus Magnetomorum sp. HK-1]
MTKSKLKVFLSHASQDKEHARELFKKLCAEGMEPWLDESSLVPGQLWDDEIKKAINRSDAFLVCLTNQSITKAGYVQKEVIQALDIADKQPEGSIYLIPVLLEQCNIPDRLSKFHAANLYEKNGYQLLIEALRIRSIELDRSTESIKKDSFQENAKFHRNFPQELIRLYWEKFPEIKLKKNKDFTVSIVGKGGVGKTALTWWLTGYEYGIIENRHLKSEGDGPFSYRIPFKRNMYIVDHSGYYPEIQEDWNEAVKYIKETSDLLLFICRAGQPIDELFLKIIKLFSEMPLSIVVTCTDIVSKNDLMAYENEIEKMTGKIPLPLSVKEGFNLSNLVKFVTKSRQMYL